MGLRCGMKTTKCQLLVTSLCVMLLGLSIATLSTVTHYGPHFTLIRDISLESNSYRVIHHTAFYFGICISMTLILAALLGSVAMVRESQSLTAMHAHFASFGRVGCLRFGCLRMIILQRGHDIIALWEEEEKCEVLFRSRGNEASHPALSWGLRDAPSLFSSSVSAVSDSVRVPSACEDAGPSARAAVPARYRPRGLSTTSLPGICRPACGCSSGSAAGGGRGPAELPCLRPALGTGRCRGNEGGRGERAALQPIRQWENVASFSRS